MIEFMIEFMIELWMEGWIAKTEHFWSTLDCAIVHDWMLLGSPPWCSHATPTRR